MEPLLRCEALECGPPRRAAAFPEASLLAVCRRIRSTRMACHSERSEESLQLARCSLIAGAGEEFARGITPPFGESKSPLPRPSGPFPKNNLTIYTYSSSLEWGAGRFTRNPEVAGITLAGYPAAGSGGNEK